MTTFTITCVPYYDKYNKCYKNILTTNGNPAGPLAPFVRQIQYPKLSPFQQSGPCHNLDKCVYAISSSIFGCKNSCGDLMTSDDIYNLTSYLMSHGYQIETQITNMLNNSNIKMPKKTILYTVTYYGDTTPQICYMR